MTDSEYQRPVRRSVIVAAMTIVAVSVVLVALRSWLERTAATVNVAIETETMEPIEPPTVDAAPFVAAEPSSVEVALVARVDPIRVVLLQGPPVYDETYNPLAPAAANEVREATLRALLTMPGVEIMDVSTSDRQFQEADIVAVFSAEPALSDSLPWLISMQLRQPDIANGMSAAFYTANGLAGDKLGQRYAETLVQIAGNRVISAPKVVAKVDSSAGEVMR